MLEINEDLKANEAYKYFDNICNERGEKLTKAAKRSQLMLLMRKLYYFHPEQNICTLNDGREVPIIITKKYPKHGEACYFNTSAAPAEEIFEAFAEKMRISCRFTRPEPKKEEELIVNDIKHLFDNVNINGKKVTDVEKHLELKRLFNKLYHSPEQNIVCTPDGKKIPIIVERLSVNNWGVLCLNTSEYRTEVMQAFADFANCTYCKEKEGLTNPPERNKKEMTARECARIFHGVPNLDGSMTKRDASPKLVEWFAHIYNHPTLNKTTLPDGREVPLLVHRISRAQKCYCLNTSDESVKPFVIKAIADITEAIVCLDNLKIHTDDAQSVCKAIKLLKQASSKTKRAKDISYYRAYANKAFHTISPQSRYFSAEEWLIASHKGKSGK